MEFSIWELQVRLHTWLTACKQTHQQHTWEQRYQCKKFAAKWSTGASIPSSPAPARSLPKIAHRSSSIRPPRHCSFRHRRTRPHSPSMAAGQSFLDNYKKNTHCYLSSAPSSTPRQPSRTLLYN
jgi:hypothetical protein